MAAAAAAAGLVFIGTCGCREMVRGVRYLLRSAKPRATPEPAVPFPAGDLSATHFAFEFAVYHRPRPTTDPLVEAKRLAAAAGLALREGAPAATADVATVYYRSPAVGEYAPPAVSSLQYSGKGMSEKEKQAVQSTQVVTVLAFRGPARGALPTYRSALALAAALRERTGGFLWDEETRNVFSDAAWARRLEGWESGVPDVREHIVIHTFLKGDLTRLVTLGMSKFALPDVTVSEVASSDVRSMGRLVNLTCQLMLERGRLDQAGRLDAAIDAVAHPAVRKDLLQALSRGAKRRVDVHLQRGRRQEGDADNRLIEIAFPGKTSALQERQTVALQTLFGVEDAIVHVSHTDDLLAVSQRAKATALAMKPRYAKGRPELETLLVKAPFATPDGGNEWMWVEVVRWEGTTIHGILQNNPFKIPTLKAGARVRVQEAEIFDYILHKSDGTSEGNETARLLREQADGAGRD